MKAKSDRAFKLTRESRRMTLLVAMIAMLLTACVGNDEMRWEEQVWLNDDTMINVERYSVRKKSGFPNSRRGTILKEEIRYTSLNFYWSDEGSGEHPLSFEIVNGIVYLATIPSVPREKYCAGKMRGSPYAKFYRSHHGKISIIAAQEAPVQKMRKNLSGVSHWGYDSASDRTYLSWSDVADATLQPRAGPPTPIWNVFNRRKSLRCP